jgi:TPP-dependent pyruvate/acetoin dehydrogenase alpha subunit
MELPQVVMARVFRKGDFRSGYYRDQTFMFATGMATIQEFFAQLYSCADVEADPGTAGRAMNAHFATRSLDGAIADYFLGKVVETLREWRMEIRE